MTEVSVSGEAAGFWAGIPRNDGDALARNQREDVNLQMKSRRIFVAMVMAVFMAALMAASAFAATSDPYMTSYELGASGYVYTYDDLPWAGRAPRTASAYLTAGPSADEETPSYFDSEADALAVKWSFIDDRSVYVVQFTDKGAYQDTGGWVAYAVVEIFDSVTPTQFGAVSIQALNPNATDPHSGENSYVNFTLQINEEGTPAYTSAPHIGYQVWDPASGTSAQVYTTTDANDFYETLEPARTYPNLLDGVYDMKFNEFLIDDYTFGFIDGIGYNVQSMVVDSINYVNNARMGWQYRIYRQVGQYHVALAMSTVVGPDAPKLIEDDIVVWKYAPYDNPNLFPAAIQAW
jgi:hypothetical protein